MTNREFFETIINGTINDEIIAKANDLLSSLDAKNAKRRDTVTKDKAEVIARREAVLQYLQSHDGIHTRDEIAEAVGISANQVTSACNALVSAEMVTKSDIKVDKSRKVGYAIA